MNQITQSIVSISTALESLRTAAIAGDDAGCRRHLETVLHGHCPMSNGKMHSYKARRAFDFRIEGNQVSYKITRHPGLSNWLLHRDQTRKVDLRSGHEWVCDDELPQLNVDDLARFAARTTERRPAKAVDYQTAAAAAVAYANEVGKYRPFQYSEWERDVAIGWVATICATHTLPRGWKGRASHVVSAERANLNDMFNMEDGKQIVELAARLWSELPREVLR